MESESGKFACAHQARWVSEVQPFFVPLTLRCGLDSLEYTAAKKVAPRQTVRWRNGLKLRSRRPKVRLLSTRLTQNHSPEPSFVAPNRLRMPTGDLGLFSQPDVSGKCLVR